VSHPGVTKASHFLIDTETGDRGWWKGLNGVFSGQTTPAPTRFSFSGVTEWSCPMAQYYGAAYIEACYKNVNCNLEAVHALYST
jgi:hypothetical protein